jgi:two-component system, LytTR family, response regulator
MTIRALIVDDEPLARRRIRQLLAGAPDVEVVGDCEDGAEAIHAIRSRRPDLVFLDVQMPPPDGFGVIEAVGVEAMPVVIFVTAHDEHALRAFDVHALDYLLKPFDRERFLQAVARARTAIAKGLGQSWQDELRALIATTRAPAPHTDRLVVRSTGRLTMVRVDAIHWIQAEGNYVRLHVDKGSHLLRDTIASLESRLHPGRFRRIHRSTIVNLDRIQDLRPALRGDYVVTLVDGRRLTLSRTYRDRLPELFA